MKEEWINNYGAARELDAFKKMYLDTLNKRIEKAKEVLDDKKYPWKENGREKALKAFKEIEGQNINFHRLYNAVFKMIGQHEKLTSRLCDLYSKWYEQVAWEGQQPKEMMSGQVEILQAIFTEIYNFIEPIVKNEIKAPSND